MIPRGDGSDGTYNPDQWMEPKEQRKVDEFIVFAMCAARQALDDAGWHPQSYEDQTRTGVLIGSGIGGIEGIADTAITLKERGPAPGVAVLHSRPHHQSRRRLRLDRVRAQGPEPRGGHRLFDRRARHRRCRAADRARRRRRHGRGRHRIAGQPHGARRLLRRCARCRPASTTTRPTPRALTTRTATASSWARAPASWCWNSSSTPRRAAPRSTPSSSATACRATPITSPRRRRTATAPFAA